MVMVLVNDCRSDVPPVNISDSDSEKGACAFIVYIGKSGIS